MLFLAEDGTVQDESRIDINTAGLDGIVEYDDFFGSSLASVGDLNVDGVPDIIVGAPLDDDGGNGTGALWVLFLNADGTVKHSQKISQMAGGFAGILNDIDRFGDSVVSPADIDGDGVMDIVAGAPRDDDRGAVWVLFLSKSPLR